MSDAPKTTKVDIRKRMRAILTEMDEARRHAASVSACGKLLSLESFSHAGVVMLYMSMTNEVDITPVAVRCFQLGKTVCVPKVNWNRRTMDAVEVTSLDDHVLDCDEHGVRSPKICRPIVPQLIELVVAPGLAFDLKGNRLGRSGGYYDRFLANLKPSVTKVGVAFDQQIVDRVPAMAHDIPMDIVVTDRRIAYAKSAGTKA